MTAIMMLTVLVIYLWIASTAWTAFTSVAVNRFSFRYFFTFSLVGSLQVAIYFFLLVTGDDSLAPARYVAFMVQEILLFGLLIYRMKNRKLELMVRATFYFVLLLSTAHYCLILDIVKLGILISLALTSSYPILRRWLTIALAFFIANYACYFAYGIDSIPFTALGLGFSLSLGIGAYNLYHEELKNA